MSDSISNTTAGRIFLLNASWFKGIFKICIYVYIFLFHIPLIQVKKKYKETKHLFEFQLCAIFLLIVSLS